MVVKSQYCEEFHNVFGVVKIKLIYNTLNIELLYIVCIIAKHQQYWLACRKAGGTKYYVGYDRSRNSIIIF